MSNYNNRRNGGTVFAGDSSSNQERVKKLAADIANTQKSLRQALSKQEEEHDHKKDAQGNACVKRLTDTNRNINNKPWYDEYTVICEDCGAIFSTKCFTAEEIYYALFVITSSFHQTKLLANLSDEDWEQMEQLFASEKLIERFETGYYLPNLKSLSGKKHQGSGKNSFNKGGIGLESSSFNIRR